MSGSEYFNYKGYFSIVLLALASYDYKLIFVDVGASGRNGDAGLFETSPLNQQMKDKSIAFPEAEQFGETCIKFFFVFFGRALPLLGILRERAYCLRSSHCDTRFTKRKSPRRAIDDRLKNRLGGWVANGAESASKFDVDLTEKPVHTFCRIVAELHNMSMIFDVACDAGE
eukprot:gene4426-20660_t